MSGWAFVLDVALRVVSLVGAFVAGWCLSRGRYHRGKADAYLEIGDALREQKRLRDRAPWN